MRWLFGILLLILFVGIVGFLVTNPVSTVPITIWNTEYDDVKIGYVVIFSVFVGVVFASIFALIEGTVTRIENRRLRRELQKRESELKYLRTQPPSIPRSEPDALEPAPGGSKPEIGQPPGDDMASAPVYGTERKDDWRADSDDDAYTGGSAV